MVAGETTLPNSSRGDGETNLELPEPKTGAVGGVMEDLGNKVLGKVMTQAVQEDLRSQFEEIRRKKLRKMKRKRGGDGDFEVNFDIEKPPSVIVEYIKVREEENKVARDNHMIELMTEIRHKKKEKFVKYITEYGSSLRAIEDQNTIQS